MPKYRKKPVVIEAEQWFPGKPVVGILEEISLVDFKTQEETPAAIIDTLEGQMVVRPGDYVITGIQGERYPCKPDIFEATYEAVEDDAR